MRHSRRLLLAGLAATVPAGLIAGAAPAAAQTTVTLTHALPLTSHYGAGSVAFKETVERLSNGRFRVNIQRNDNEREGIEATQIGTQEFTITSTGPVGNFVPDVLLLDIPFLFRDYAHARGVLDSAIGQEILAKFSARGLVGMAWMENGFRNLTNSRREVNAPDDVKGLKVRTMENQVHMRAFSTLGALPTPMAFSELVPALQQGTVDGQENPIPVIVANNLNQVQRFLSLTRHVYSPAVLIGNPAFLNRLSAADRAIFVQAAKAAVDANRNKVTEDEQNGVAELRRRGMTVRENVDTAAFQAALAPAFQAYAQQFGAANIDRIRNWRPGS
jgi:tripartite ATP-independent transporter DctP family solute receptor